MRRRGTFLLVVLLLHLPLFAYPILRLCDWLGLDGWTTSAIFVPLFFSQIAARLYLRHANYGLVFWLRRAADLWLGVSPLLLGMLLVAELPVGLGWIAAPTVAYSLLGISGALLVYSVANAYSPSVVKVPLRSHKLAAPLRFAQITDVHIGSRSSAFLARVIAQVNGTDAQFLCITGDFIDTPGITEQLIGIDDSENPAQVQRELAKLTVDTKRFVLLLYHRPRGLPDAARAGVDLMLSGHTHNGQIVPFNLVVGRVFEQIVGRFSHGQTQLYVSPGTGTWGPVMRLGSRGEVTLFEVLPAAV